jgi:hypothetical protein
VEMSVDGEEPDIGKTGISGEGSSDDGEPQS